MSTLLQELRYSLRRLAQAPGFSLAAIATLAVGIGVTTAIWSVVHGVLMAPLPHPHPERLVAFQSNVSRPDLNDILAWSKTIAAGGGYVPQPLDLVGSDTPVQVDAALVTGDLFRALGARAERGRVLDASDDRVGAARSVMVSHAFWKGRLGGQAGALGRTLALSGKTYTIVGILPAGFELPRGNADVFGALAVVYPEGATARGVHFLRTCLRLAPGRTLADANHEMTAIGRRLAEIAPDENQGREWRLVSLLDRVVGNVRKPLWILFGAVVLALLVACTNFANLLLARSVGRAQEFAVRASLGAGRRHLVRQMLVESTILALLGGAFGVVLAAWGVDLLVRLQPDNLPRLAHVGVDWNVLAFAAAVSLATGLLFGLIPALHQNVQALSEALKRGASTSVSGRGSMRLLRLLAASQIALALMLLIGAGLLLNGFVRLTGVEPGFDPRQVLTFRIELPEARYHDHAAQIRYQERVLETVGRLPGAQVALVSELPLGGDALTHNFIVEGAAPIAPGQEPELFSRSVASDYFGVMRIPIRAGRALESGDRAEAPRVGVINEAMARRYFAGQNPIGRRMRWAHEEPVQWITIVGVAADVRHFGLDSDELPAIYTPYAQFGADWKRWMNVVVRSPEPAGPLARRVEQLVWAVDPAIPVTQVRSFGQVVAASLAGRRFNLLLIGIFAAVALVLAAIGIYGVTAYGVGRRTREIGVRMALGASQRDVWRMVVGSGLRFVGAGVVAGVVGALAVSRVITSLLFGVRATDPLTYVAVAVVLVMVALVACAIPAGRAARLESHGGAEDGMIHDRRGARRAWIR